MEFPIKYYFVHYTKAVRFGTSVTVHDANTIVVGCHPLTWAAQNSESERYITIHNFIEIESRVLLTAKVRGHFGVTRCHPDGTVK